MACSTGRTAAAGDPREDLATATVRLALVPALRPESALLAAALTAVWPRAYAERRPMPSNSELRPFLAAAARAQADRWEHRARTAPTEILDRARELADTPW